MHSAGDLFGERMLHQSTLPPEANKFHIGNGSDCRFGRAPPRQPVEACCICGAECDGTLMRHDVRYTKVHDMLTSPDIPMMANGINPRLCHRCQRRTHFAGGFLYLLTDLLDRPLCNPRLAWHTSRG